MKTCIVYSVFLLLLTGCDYEVTSSPTESDLSQISLSKGVVAKKLCTTIPGGELYNLVGDLILPGYDDWGYNYQARLFNGLYCDSYRNEEWCWPYKDVQLSMKWNDAWLSNMDCDDDGLLDRHLGYDSYSGSGAWLTNHQSGEDEIDGVIVKWNYFVKIVAAPADADVNDGIWYTADGVEIGPVIWGAFAIIQSVYNDQGSGDHGIEYLSPNGPGFGKF